MGTVEVLIGDLWRRSGVHTESLAVWVHTPPQKLQDSSVTLTLPPEGIG